MNTSRLLTGIVTLSLLAGLAPNVFSAEKSHHHEPTITLEHTQQQEVANDIASVSLFFETKDKDAGLASQKATVALNNALAKLKSETGVQEKRSSIQTYSDFGADGKVSGWRARVELTLDGSDFADLSKAASKTAPDFAFASISYRLSTETRQKEEQRLMSKAIQAFREKAQTISTAFGFSGYQLADVAVKTSSDLGSGPRFRAEPMMMASAMSSDPATAGLEGGKARVTVSVTGAISPR